jgi:hypothetical protein
MVRALAAALLASAALVGVPAGPADASGNSWYDRYVAMDAAVGGSLYTSPDSATLAWGESYVLSSYVDVYKLSRDTAWLDKLTTHVDRIIANAGDEDGDGYAGWSTSRYSPQELLNTGFETVTSGDSTMAASWVRWQTNTTNAHRTTDRATGSYGLQIDSDGALWRKVYQRLGTYEPNTIYDLKFSAKTNGSAAGGRVYIIDQTTDVILCSTAFTNTAWTAFSLACRTPAAAGHVLEVWLGHDNYRIAGGRALFDDVSVKGRFPYMVHDGMVGTPIAQFIRLAHQTPSLAAQYHAKAAEYRAFLETEIVPRWESSGYIGNTWVSSARTYTQSPNFDAFSHAARVANDFLPYNQSIAYGRMLLLLHQVNGNATYLDRARGTGQFLKNGMTLDGEAYTWKYSSRSAAGSAEDTSHANIDIGAARELYDSGNIFTATDMQRITNALTQKMWNGSLTAPVVKKYVNGTGDNSMSIYLVEWAEYAQWAKNILPIIAEQYRSTGNSAYAMLALARIMKWDRSKLVNQGFDLATSFDATQPAQWNRIGSTATTAFRDAANAFEGSYGLTIRSISGAAQQVNQTWEGWTPGTPYTLSFVGKATGAAGGRVRVLNETTGGVLADTTFHTTEWEQVSVGLTSPAVAGEVVRVYIGNADPAVAGTAHIDTIKLRVTGDSW